MLMSIKMFLIKTEQINGNFKRVLSCSKFENVNLFITEYTFKTRFIFNHINFVLQQRMCLNWTNPLNTKTRIFLYLLVISRFTAVRYVISVYASFATCRVRCVRVRYILASRRTSSLPQPAEFDSAVDERTRSNLCAWSLRAIYFCFAKF